MLLHSFQTVTQTILGLVFLGSIGFFVVRKGVISEDGLKCVSDLVIKLFLPFLMFSEIINKFNFSLYSNWWVFPILSIFIAAVGFAIGLVFLYADKSIRKNSSEFLGITTFQNSGYLPLPLVASLLPKEMASEMFIYIFLFLVGFNMVIFSFGVLLFSSKKDKCGSFDLKHMFNAPVIATLLALIFVFFKINTILPDIIVKPISTVGSCAIPLSILVVGGNLAAFNGGFKFNLKSISYALMIKLLILPLLFLGFIILAKPKPLIGLLILLQAAMPPAALLSVISKAQNHKGELIHQAIFYGHIISIVTIPLFLILFSKFVGVFY